MASGPRQGEDTGFRCPPSPRPCMRPFLRFRKTVSEKDQMSNRNHRGFRGFRHRAAHEVNVTHPTYEDAVDEESFCRTPDSGRDLAIVQDYLERRIEAF